MDYEVNMAKVNIDFALSVMAMFIKLLKHGIKLPKH